MSVNLMNSNVDVLPGINHILDEAKEKIQALTGTKVFIRISESPTELNDEALQHLVCKEFNVSWSKLVSADRNRELVDARSIYCHLAHNILGKSKVLLGLQLNRHHSSIIHLLDRAKDLIDANDKTLVPVLHKIEQTISRSYERIED